ncbi:hypothetical protein [Xanthomonas oryzae]|uniref:hypothetical protein n=1 Tax=Xanthomonas oryzae TaxID=347 RepID=UPI001F5FBA9F|nr:hypothetical protein [Xanthomonas oryzae]
MRGRRHVVSARECRYYPYAFTRIRLRVSAIARCLGVRRESVGHARQRRCFGVQCSGVEQGQLRSGAVHQQQNLDIAWKLTLYSNNFAECSPPQAWRTR